jgi:hypothetical protein
MPFESSVFQREVDAIVKTGAKGVFFRWEAELHADGKSMEVYYVDVVEFQRDYKSQSFDVISIEINVSAGSFEKYIVPHKDKLELTLKQIPLNELKPAENQESAIRAYRYRATLYDGNSGIVAGNNPALQNMNAADNAMVKSVRLQLFDKVTEQIRLKTVGTVFRRTTTANAVAVALGKMCKGLKNEDNSYAVKGVDVAPGFIEEQQSHIVVPHMTKLVTVPQFVHENYGGIYNFGLGYYLQDSIWYLYGLYDIKRYEKCKKTLTILNVPAERYPNPERSYRNLPNQLIILATGEVEMKDETEAQAMNQGLGVRFADANRLFESFAKTGDNKAIASRGENTAEFIAEERPTGINNAQASGKGITSNYAVERGNLAGRAGCYVQLVWEASVQQLLYPGMPTKLMYLENERAQEVYGVLLHAHTFHTPVATGIKNRKFVSKTIMTLFVDKKVQVQDPEYAE